MVRKFRFLMFISIGALTGCSLGHTAAIEPTKPIITGEGQTYKNLDVMERAIAGDVAERLGWLKDDGSPDTTYDIQVYRGGPILGALVQGGQNRLVNNETCHPSTDPTWNAINVFGTYEISGNLAFKLGLPLPAVPIGVNAAQDLTSAYALTDAEMMFLPADELSNLMKTPGCRSRIAALEGPAWIVRGLIKAKRSYNFYLKNSAGLSFTIPGATDTGLSGWSSTKGAGQDTTARLYFMILTPVKPAPPLPPRPAPPPLPPVPASSELPDTPAPNICGSFTNRVYVQKDQADRSDHDRLLITALSKTELDVVPEVQRIDSDRVPRSAQVRYFYPEDEDAAKCVLSFLHATDPSAMIRRLNSASPQGQLEVWFRQQR